ncbi:MAG: hypothetical protein AAB526_02850 [Patescibacteria group bacterium]
MINYSLAEKMEAVRKELSIRFGKRDIIFGRYVDKKMDKRVSNALNEAREIFVAYDLSFDEAKNIFPIVYKTAGWRGQENVPFDYSLDNVAYEAHSIAQEILARIKIGTYIPISSNGRVKILSAFDAREGSREYAIQRAKIFALYPEFDVFLLKEIIYTPAGISFTRKSLGEKGFDFVFLNTASHNPVGWHGDKFLHNGSTNPSLWTGNINKRANEMRINKDSSNFLSINSELNRIKEISLKKELIKRYKKVFFNLDKKFKKFQKTHLGIINIVDFMHGSAIGLELFFKRAGLNVVRSIPMCKGTYPKNIKENNKKIIYQPDPTIETFLKLEPTYLKFIKTAIDGSTYMAIDGDGDRLRTLIKHKGKVIDLIPNKFATFAIWYLDKKGMIEEDAKIFVRSMVSSRRADVFAKKQGYTLKVTPVGSKFFEPFMIDFAKTPATVAMEESGHMAFRVQLQLKNNSVAQEVFFDDTIFQINLMLKMMAEEKKTLGEIYDEFDQFLGFSGEYNRINVENVEEQILFAMKNNPMGLAQQIITEVQKKIPNKKVVRIWVVAKDPKVGEIEISLDKTTKDQQIQFREGIGIQWGDFSWGSLRLSGTENLCRIYSEAGTEQERKIIEQAFCAII